MKGFNIEDLFLIEQVEETSSTNTLIKENNNIRIPFHVITAKYQTNGRGQKGNYWESEKGENLIMSLSCNIKISINHYFILSIIISLAIKKTLDLYTEDIKIKWPNDIYWKEFKLGGILIENDINSNFITRSIIGLGLNLNQTKFISDAPNPSSLKLITGKDYNINTILNEILKNFYLIYQGYTEKGTKKILEEYSQSLFRNTGYFSYKDNKDTFIAKFVNVSLNGKITLKERNGKFHRYYFKEVTFLIKKPTTEITKKKSKIYDL